MRRRRPIRWNWIVGGWLISLVASALPVAWVLAGQIARNPLRKFVDPLTGEWMPHVYITFFQWWLPVAIPVSLLAMACMFLNRPD